MNDTSNAHIFSTIAAALHAAADEFSRAAENSFVDSTAQQATPPASAGPWQQQQNTPPAAQQAPAANPWQQATSGNITPIAQAAAQAPQFTEQDVMQRFQTISQRLGPDPITGEGGLLRTAGVQRVSELRADQYPAVIAHADAILAGQGGAA